MENKVTICGCFSEKGGKDTEMVNLKDTANMVFSIKKLPEKLVMQKKISQVGNQIKITLESNTYDKENSFWLEKTDIPYMEGMGKNKWSNMIGVASHVFDNIYGSAEEARNGGADEVIIIDPPTARVDTSRRLEFIVYLRGEDTRKNFLMLAEQNIAADKETGKHQVEFTVYQCGFVKKREELQPENQEEKRIRELEEMVSGDSSSVQMEELRNCVSGLSKDYFESVPVEYMDSQIYRFNGWGKET